LVKTPDKLQLAVAIASQEKSFPTAADFAKAVQKVVPKNTSPTRTSSTKQEKVKTQLCNSVTVSSLSHPRFCESGVIETDAPNVWQQIVTFADGEKVLVNNTDLDAPSVSFPRERTYPAEYTEAIAAIEERHKQELERLSQELRIGLQAEATARAEEQIKEQLQAYQKLLQQQKEQNIQLQQRLDEMEGLHQLEAENQQLQQRIQELEHAVEERPLQQWGNIMTQQATKALNKQVKLALRSLAVEPPKENAQECLRLMGMALGNLASAMNKRPSA
jgi:myosin heavy subunit